MTADANGILFLKNLGSQQYAGPLAAAGFTSMAELSLITAKALKAANILEGYSLPIPNHLKKRRALGVVLKAIPADFIAKRKQVCSQCPSHFALFFSSSCTLNAHTVDALGNT